MKKKDNNFKINELQFPKALIIFLECIKLIDAVSKI